MKTAPSWQLTPTQQGIFVYGDKLDEQCSFSLVILTAEPTISAAMDMVVSKLAV
jgi:hypothetical protein